MLVTSATHGGVDVERMERTNDLPLVASKICVPIELKSLNRLSGEAWKERFFQLWTLKEAYAKARAPGPPLNWQDVAFEMDAQDKATVRFAPQVADHPAGWKFWLHRITAEHMLAAAVGDGAASEPSELIIQSVKIRAEKSHSWMETLGEGRTVQLPA